MTGAHKDDNHHAAFPAENLPPLIFLGPTLPVSKAHALLQGCYRPPARRGDIYRAIAEGYKTIVLIDGEFHGAPSVWQREIADALAEGVEVHGASSMGALRAAELHPLGMIGHGTIFAWFRDGKLDADDEVALVYGPAGRGYPPGSEPMVNIRATLEAGVPEILTPEEHNALIDFMKSLYYPERSFATLLEKGPAAEWPKEQRERLALFLQERRIDQKREDAMEALAAVAAGTVKRTGHNGSGRAHKFWRRERLVAEGVMPHIEANAAEIAKCAGISDQEIMALRRELSTLFFVAQWGREHDVVPTDGDMAWHESAFPAAARIPPPRRKGLLAARALAQSALRVFSAMTEANAAGQPQVTFRSIIRHWARENGIESPGLEGEALADWIIEAGPGHFGYTWSFDVELAGTLWLLGKAAGPQSQGAG